MRERSQALLVSCGRWWLGLAALGAVAACSPARAKPPAPAGCDGLDYCGCVATSGCEVKSQGCLCPCDFGCPKGCVCACGGGKYLGCQARRSGSPK